MDLERIYCAAKTNTTDDASVKPKAGSGYGRIVQILIAAFIAWCTGHDRRDDRGHLNGLSVCSSARDAAGRSLNRRHDGQFDERRAGAFGLESANTATDGEQQQPAKRLSASPRRFFLRLRHSRDSCYVCGRLGSVATGIASRRGRCVNARQVSRRQFL
jgi:hypothetical protein